MIKIDREKSIAVITVQGTPKVSDIRHTIEALLDHPDHLDGMDEIWDFREASLTFSANELEDLALFVNQHLDKLARHTALVVSKDLEYGIARMWSAYAEAKAPQVRHIFRDMEEALDWLTLQSENKKNKSF